MRQVILGLWTVFQNQVNVGAASAPSENVLDVQFAIRIRCDGQPRHFFQVIEPRTDGSDVVL